MPLFTILTQNCHPYIVIWCRALANKMDLALGKFFPKPEGNRWTNGYVSKRRMPIRGARNAFFCVKILKLGAPLFWEIPIPRSLAQTLLHEFEKVLCGNQNAVGTWTELVVYGKQNTEGPSWDQPTTSLSLHWIWMSNNTKSHLLKLLLTSHGLGGKSNEHQDLLLRPLMQNSCQIKTIP